jgi:membrane glycosyltransferase
MLNEMKSASGGKKFLYWAPRVLSIIMVCFISLFAFDVFDQDYTAGELAVALFMHLLPTILGVICIVIAWKMERLGGWLFVALGVAYLFIGSFELATILVVTLPLVIIGALFLGHYYKYVKGTKDSATPAALSEK